MESNSTFAATLHLNLNLTNSSESSVNNSGSSGNRFSWIASSSVINSGIMFGFGVFGNVLALIVLAMSPKQQRRTIFYRLVAGLTITDLVGTALLSPIVIAVYVRKEWFGGVYVCNYFGYCMMFFGFATMLIVCTMSIERVCCIKYPYLYHTRLLVKHATIILVSCWLLAAFMSALPLMGFGKIIRKWPDTWCFIDYYTDIPLHKAFNCLYGTLALTFILVTVCCNFTVIITILRSRRSQSLLKSKNGNTRKYNGRNKQYAECQMLILLIGITIVFTSCYAPLMVRIIMNQTNLVQKNRNLDLLLIRLASYNQIIDPWVYILLRREVVWKLISGIKFLCGVSQSHEEEVLQQIQNADREDENCCLFCLRCLCDPPTQRNRAGSVFSESVYDRRCTIMTSSPLPGKRLALASRKYPSPSINRSSSLSTSLNNLNRNCRLDDLRISSNKELHLLLHRDSNSSNAISSF